MRYSLCANWTLTRKPQRPWHSIALLQETLQIFFVSVSVLICCMHCYIDNFHRRQHEPYSITQCYFLPLIEYRRSLLTTFMISPFSDGSMKQIVFYQSGVGSEADFNGDDIIVDPSISTLHSIYFFRLFIIKYFRGTWNGCWSVYIFYLITLFLSTSGTS